jgi:signal transduction histidine kinase
MPTLISIALCIIAGFAFSSGISALFLAVRRQQPVVQLTFAVMCLLVALASITRLMLYNTAELTQHITLLRTQVTLSIMIGVMMMWFTMQFTGIGQSLFLKVWTVFGALLIIANSIGALNSLVATVTRVDGFAVPWGEQVFTAQTMVTPYAYIYALFPLGVFAFAIHGCVRQYLRGARREALTFGAVVFLLGFAAAHDIVIQFLTIKALGLFEFSLGLLMLMVTSQFSEEIISTEQELRDHKQDLEQQVTLRTSDLSHANVMMAQEVRTRKHTEEALQGRVRDLNALSRISQRITLATVNELPAALGDVFTMTRALFNAASCHIHMPEALLLQYPQMRQTMTGFDMRLALAPGVVPTEVPAVHDAIENGESVIVSDTTRDDRVKDGQTYFMADHVHAIMLAPLKVRGNTIGCIAVVSQEPGRRFGTPDLTLLENIASDVASALENARLYFHAQQSAVDIERQRLARELHDSVTQSLYSLTLLANGWGTMASNNKLPDVPGSFKQLVDVGQQALKEMRLLIHQLRPPILEQAGLAGALRQRLEAVERRVEIKTKLLVDGAVDNLSLDVQEQLFNIAQEALNNSLRHAHAKSVLIEINVDHGMVLMSVEDDGIGYDPESVSTGLGTLTMRERAAQIGGSVQVRTAQNAGTTVEVTVQLNPQPAL